MIAPGGRVRARWKSLGEGDEVGTKLGWRCAGLMGMAVLLSGRMVCGEAGELFPDVKAYEETVPAPVSVK